MFACHRAPRGVVLELVLLLLLLAEDGFCHRGFQPRRGQAGAPSAQGQQHQQLHQQFHHQQQLQQPGGGEAQAARGLPMRLLQAQELSTATASSSSSGSGAMPPPAPASSRPNAAAVAVGGSCTARGDCNAGPKRRALSEQKLKQLEDAKVGNVSRPVEGLLREKLFENYDKEIYPWEETGGPAAIHMRLAIQKIVGVDLLQGQLSVLVWWSLRWQDPRLTWDDKEWNVSQVYVGNEYESEGIEVWQPEMVMWNEAIRSSDTMHHHATILTSDGTIVWSRHGTLTAACNLQGMNGFPYKTLSCLMEFGDWTYSPRYVQLYPDAGNIMPGVSIGGSDTSLANATTDTYTLKSVTCERHEYGAYPCCPDDSYWPVLWYTFNFKHAESLYTVKIILSQALLTIIGFTSFWLNPVCGERISLAITIPLAAAVYDLLVFQQLPNSNTISFISLFGLISFTISMLVALETAIVIQLHYYTDASWSPINGFSDTWRQYAEQRDWIKLLVYLDQRLQMQQNEAFKEGGRHRWKDKATQLLHTARSLRKGKHGGTHTVYTNLETRTSGASFATSADPKPSGFTAVADQQPAPELSIVGGGAGIPSVGAAMAQGRGTGPSGREGVGGSVVAGGSGRPPCVPPSPFSAAAARDGADVAATPPRVGSARTSRDAARLGRGGAGAASASSVQVAVPLSAVPPSISPRTVDIAKYAKRWRRNARRAAARRARRAAAAAAAADAGLPGASDEERSAGQGDGRPGVSGQGRGAAAAAGGSMRRPRRRVMFGSADNSGMADDQLQSGTFSVASVGSETEIASIGDEEGRTTKSPGSVDGGRRMPTTSMTFASVVDASVKRNRKLFSRSKKQLDPEAKQALDTALHTQSRKMLRKLLQDIMDSEAGGIKPLQRAILRSLARFDMEHLVNRLVTVLGGSGDKEGDGARVRRGDMDDWSYTADSGPDPRNFRDMVGPEYNRRWRLMGKMVDHVCRFVFPLTYATAILVVCLVDLT